MKQDYYKKLHEVVDLQLHGFEHNVPPGSIRQLSFDKRSSYEWYSEFKNRVFNAMGKRYLPVYRMGDGEFIFCVGRKPELLPRSNNYATTLFFHARAGAVSIINRFRLSERTCWGECYDGIDRSNLMKHYIGCLGKVSMQGMLALHFVESPDRFSEQYIVPMCKWFAENSIQISNQNYTSFYFIYALLCGPDSLSLFVGRRVLVISSSDAKKQSAISKSLQNLGAMNVQFITISSNQALLDNIDLSKINVPFEIVLVAAGIGAVNILAQLEPLETVCLDVGICLEILANQAKRARIFTLPNESIMKKLAVVLNGRLSVAE